MGGSGWTALRLMRWSGWFAVRTSSTEDVDKIYAESFTARAICNLVIKLDDEALQEKPVLI